MNDLSWVARFESSRWTKIWVALIVTLPLAAVYLAGPNNRIYSFHGFVHTAISYQISNGAVPPAHPFLAGQPLFYHWGFHFLGAWLSAPFNISPFWSFAAINIASLFCTAILIYALSSLLIRDARANTLSVIVGIWALTPLPTGTLLPLPLVRTTIYPILKYCDLNAVPSGLMFYLLFLYALVRLFSAETFEIRYMAALLVSIVAGGFFYPPFTPGIASCFVLLPIALLAIRARTGDPVGDRFKRYLVVTLVAIAGGFLLWPYLSSISSGIAGSMHFFRAGNGLIKAASFFAVYTPALLVIYLARRSIRQHTDKTALLVLGCVLCANLVVHIVVNQPLLAEIKYRILAGVPLGVLAGVGFHYLMQQYDKRLVSFILVLFLLPSCYAAFNRSRMNRDAAQIVVERGAVIESADPEEQEMYEWIRFNTASESVFIDSIPIVPVLAQRRLFVFPRQLYMLGFRGSTDLFFNGDDRQLVENRRVLAEAVSSRSYELSKQDVPMLAGPGQSTYLVVRKKDSTGSPNRRFWKRVFSSSSGNFSVFRIRFSIRKKEVSFDEQ